MKDSYPITRVCYLFISRQCIKLPRLNLIYIKITHNEDSAINWDVFLHILFEMISKNPSLIAKVYTYFAPCTR